MLETPSHPGPTRLDPDVPSPASITHTLTRIFTIPIVVRRRSGVGTHSR